MDENTHFEPDGSYLDEIFCRQGAALKAEEIPVLNKVNENDLKTRLKLVGYYFKFQTDSSQTQEERQKHVLWMIDHRPSDAICGAPWIKGDGRFGPFYDEAKSHWLLQVEANPQSAATIVNAGIFFVMLEPHLTRDFLARAVALEPDNQMYQVKLKAIEDILRAMDSSETE